MITKKYQITCISSKKKPKNKSVLVAVFLLYTIAITALFLNENALEVIRYISIGIIVVSSLVLINFFSPEEDIMTGFIEDEHIFITLKEEQIDLKIPFSEITEFEFIDNTANSGANALSLVYADKDIKVIVGAEIRSVKQANLKSFVQFGMDIKKALQDYDKQQNTNNTRIKFQPFMYSYWKF